MKLAHKLFKPRFHLTSDDDMIPDVDVTYQARNMFCGSDNCLVYFMCDVSHLLKTTGNCLSNSGDRKNTCYM